MLYFPEGVDGGAGRAHIETMTKRTNDRNATGGPNGTPRFSLENLSGSARAVLGADAPCETCNDRKSITRDFPTPPGQPSSLPVCVDCPDCVNRCDCGRNDKYRPFNAAGVCGRCAS